MKKRYIYSFIMGVYFGAMLYIMGYDIYTWQYWATLIPVTIGLILIGNMRDK